AEAAYWPQFHGPKRDNVSRETGLLKTWPHGGPKLLWAADKLGAGWGCPVISGGRIYVTGMFGKEGRLTCLDLGARIQWQKPYGTEWTKNYQGARHPPTIDAKSIYVMSGVAVLTAFDARTGQRHWSVDLMARFGGKLLGFGFSESVVIDGDRLICSPGAPDASVVALDKRTGKTVWASKGLSDEYGYCAPLLVDHGGTRLVVTMTARAIVGLEAATGKLLWRYPYRNRYAGHHVTPIYHDGKIFATSGYGKGGVMLKLSADGGAVEAKWTNPRLDTHYGGVVLLDGHLYGSTHKSASWVCLQWETGRLGYEAKGLGKGSVAAADGMLYCYGESGHLALVRPNPKRFDVVSSFRITRGTGQHWAHPVIYGGRLYVRHGDTLMAFDLTAGRQASPNPREEEDHETDADDLARAARRVGLGRGGRDK
ncbi:hypothetical protein LCGC14_2148110, partial [marine sediment metagenome]